MSRRCLCSRDISRPAGRQMGSNHITEHLMQPEGVQWRELWSSESVSQSISAWTRGEPGVRDSHGLRTFS